MELFTGIMLFFVGLIAFYSYQVRYFKLDLFTENGALKIFLTILSFWLWLIPYQFIILYNNAEAAPVVAITTILEAVWVYFIWINVAITFYFMMYFIIKILKELYNTAQRNKLK